MDTEEIAVKKHTSEPNTTNDRNEESLSSQINSVGPSKKKKSWVWDHFNPVEGQSYIVCCILCSEHINYGASHSTGMLERHIRRHHPKIHTDILVQCANDKQSDTAKEKVSSQGNMMNFVISTPDFENCFLDWMIQTYQPLSTCESESFRAMCKSLNKKAPVIGRECIGCLIQTKFHEAQTKMKHILKGRWYALTTDSWTSLAKVGYVTCTVHFIDDKTWKLHSLVLV